MGAVLHGGAPAGARPAESADGGPWRTHVATKGGLGKNFGSWFTADEAADRTLLVAGDLAEPGAVAVVLRAVGEAVATTGQLTVITTGAGLTGLLASVHAEHPSIGITVLRVPATEAGLRAARPFADARPGKFRELVVGADGSVSEPALAALELSGGGDFPLGPDDVALVSRACGGSALALAQVLACCGAAVAVIGEAGPDNDDNAVAGLEELRLAGARVTYEVVDPASPADMAQAVQRIESRLGPVTAIAHAVAAGAPTGFGDLTEQVLRDRLDAERAALLNLLRPVRTQRLRLILTFGSVAGRYGQAEQGPLAAASAALADQAEALAARVPGCQALHVRRPAWAGSGLGEPPGLAASMAAAGTAPIAVGDVARLLLKMLATPGLPDRVGLHGRVGSLGRGHARAGGGRTGGAGAVPGRGQGLLPGHRAGLRCAPVADQRPVPGRLPGRRAAGAGPGDGDRGDGAGSFGAGRAGVAAGDGADPGGAGGGAAGGWRADAGPGLRAGRGRQDHDGAAVRGERVWRGSCPRGVPPRRFAGQRARRRGGTRVGRPGRERARRAGRAAGADGVRGSWRRTRPA